MGVIEIDFNCALDKVLTGIEEQECKVDQYLFDAYRIRTWQERIIKRNADRKREQVKGIGNIAFSAFRKAFLYDNMLILEHEEYTDSYLFIDLTQTPKVSLYDIKNIIELDERVG